MASISISISNNGTEQFGVTSAGAVTAKNISITGGSISIADSNNVQQFAVSNQGP